MIPVLKTLLIVLTVACASAAPLEDRELQQYFQTKSRQITAESLSGIDSLGEWEKRKPAYRAELYEMLGLSPLPAKSDLHATVTGRLERDDFVVERIHFQSRPGLYVTANFYLPKTVSGPLPTILYLCGHAMVKEHGVSFGNKVAYQHHGAWFARNGYACLVLDTLQLGEIEGLHHGTYREGMWWWNSRGYTPAGVEAWNCIRALDYLETRPEVDAARFGVTGRSGGGAYSWWITALDDRIKVAAPVAGITDLQNQIADGVVEGHCDCMFFINTYRWDYPLVAALAAPRPLLICNSDKDTIFPLDGVMRTQGFVRRIYDYYGASTHLGLLITEGPHEDTQDLQVPVFRWFNRFLKHQDPVIEMAAKKFFTPQELRVFEKNPDDEQNTKIYESFVAATKVQEPRELQGILREKVFGGWPKPSKPEAFSERQWNNKGRELRSVEFYSEPGIRLRLFYFPGDESRDLRLVVLGENDLPDLARLFQDELGISVGVPRPPKETGAALEWVRPLVQEDSEAAVGFLIVRGDGSNDPGKAIQIRRRYMLAGATLDGMRIWDVRQGIEVLRSETEGENLPLHLLGAGRNAMNVLVYSAIAEKPVAKVTARELPRSEKDQPDYLNFSRFTSLETLVKQLESGDFGQAVRVISK